MTRQEMWAEEPQQSRVRRTDAASKAFQKAFRRRFEGQKASCEVKRETPQASGPAVPAWEAQEEELGPAIEAILKYL